MMHRVRGRHNSHAIILVYCPNACQEKSATDSYGQEIKF